MTKQPLLSVIIPVYNTEKYFKKCIESILECSYKNIEIIIVNDGSKGNIDELVSEYTEFCENVRYIKHDENKGLYRARITGYNSAKGDYITFVDSDDYVGSDFYRLLIESAEKTNSDIVVGSTVEDVEGVDKFVRCMPRFDKEIEGNDKIMESYFYQEGNDYYYHVVWNKLYRRKVWEKAIKELDKNIKHTVMLEDFVFSTILHYYTDKICYTTHESYFYVRNENASTNIKLNNQKQIINKLENVKNCFNFVESFLKSKKVYSKYQKHFIQWKKNILYCYLNDNAATRVTDKKIINELIRDDIELSEVRKPDSKQGVLHSSSCVWDGGMEQLKKYIIEKRPKYISFDIFDTLILRPFAVPTDVFVLMNKEYISLSGNNTFANFNELRCNAEVIARRKASGKNILNEDITLDDIYSCLYEDMGLDKAVCNKLKEKEIELEKELCYKRNSAYEIYKLAHYLGIDVICISDMYLDSNTIKSILAMNGYDNIKEVFVSSEYNLTKHTGNLYRYVKNKYKITKKEDVLHIGDNYFSDVESANANGFTGWYLPKTTDAMFMKTNGILKQLFNIPVGSEQNIAHGQLFLAARCTKALIANKYFDNPYTSFFYDSDYNCDPYLLGYAALGTGMLGIVKWLLEDSIKNGYTLIQFMARDGYLPMLVYDKMSKLYKNAPKSGYFHTSRKSLLPLMMRNPLDIHSVHKLVNIFKHSPEKFAEYLFPNNKDYVLKILEEHNVPSQRIFKSFDEYHYFCGIMIKYVFPSVGANVNSNIVKMFEESFPEKSVSFDVGYSARPQAIISKIINRPIDAYFLHINAREAYENSVRNGFKIYNYYDYTPAVIGVLREHIISSSAPSCIGYNDNGSPIFGEKDKTYTDTFIIERIHKGCLDFISDFIDNFEKYWDILDIRNHDMSALLDLFLNRPKPFDMQLFAGAMFEDQTGIGEDINIRDFWQRDLAEKGMSSYGGETNYSLPFIVKWLTVSRKAPVKLLAYMIFDRDTLKAKIKNTLQGHPVCLFLICGTYKTLRKIKRIFIPRRK